VGEALTVLLAEIVPLGVVLEVPLGDAVAAAPALPVGCKALGVLEGLAPAVREGVALAESVLLAVEVGLDVGVGVAKEERLVDAVLESEAPMVSEAVGEALTVLLAEIVPLGVVLVDAGVPKPASLLPLDVSVGVGVGVGVGAAAEVTLALSEALALLAGELLLLPVLVGEGGAESVPRVAVTAPLAARKGVALPDSKAPLGVLEGLPPAAAREVTRGRGVEALPAGEAPGEAASVAVRLTALRKGVGGSGEVAKAGSKLLAMLVVTEMVVVGEALGAAESLGSCKKCGDALAEALLANALESREAAAGLAPAPASALIALGCEGVLLALLKAVRVPPAPLLEEGIAGALSIALLVAAEEAEAVLTPLLPLLLLLLLLLLLATGEALPLPLPLPLALGLVLGLGDTVGGVQRSPAAGAHVHPAAHTTLAV
jgi:hypothetical protein